jgi:hypothetical protein
MCLLRDTQGITAAKRIGHRAARDGRRAVHECGIDRAIQRESL